MSTLNPTLRYLGPHITVCNYFTYMWTFIADHFSEEDATGTSQRIQAKFAPIAAGELAVELRRRAARRRRHGRPGLARAAGRRRRPAPVRLSARRRRDRRRPTASPASAATRATAQVFLDHRTPGNQGPTYKGRRARARRPDLLRRADRHRALGAAMNRDRGPSTFAVGADAARARADRDVPGRSPRTSRSSTSPTRSRPRSATRPASTRTRPCGSPASRSAR